MPHTGCQSCAQACTSHPPPFLFHATSLLLSPTGKTLPADARGPVAMAVGSRAHLEQAACAKRSALRNFLMHGFHLLVVAVAGGGVKDTQCGFKVSGGRGGGAGERRGGRVCRLLEREGAPGPSCITLTT
jgi:hypothetical protein